MATWSVSNIPSQKGRSIVVTGTGGLGYQDALALTRTGADVIIAGRSTDKGEDAVSSVRREVPGASIRFEMIDLASLSSIADFVMRLARQQQRLDILINNAAVMMPPNRHETSDGFELQFATNYLGHFALTAQLMPLLRKGENPRVVSLSSIAARSGIIDLDDLQAKRNYRPMSVYSQSKLACLMFALELQRRSDAAGWGLTSIAAHPGISRTSLLHNAPGRFSPMGLARSLFWFLFQPSAQGALPTLFAATSPNARPGGYYGPDKMGETRGAPARAKMPSQAEDREVAARLWDRSIQLTGASF